MSRQASPAARLPAMALSGRNGDGEFLGIEQGTIGLRLLLPLLAQRVVVDRVEVEAAPGLAPGQGRQAVGVDLLTRCPPRRRWSSIVDKLRDRRRAQLDRRAPPAATSRCPTSASAPAGSGARSTAGLSFSTRFTQATPLADARIELQTGDRLDGDAIRRAAPIRQRQAVHPPSSCIQASPPDLVDGAR